MTGAMDGSAASPASPPPASRRSWRDLGGPRSTAVVLAVFLVAYFGLRAGSYSVRSATYDEPIHLVAGYAALARHDYRMDPTHPPFLRMWAALPLWVLGVPPPDTAQIDRQEPKDWIYRAYKYAPRYLYDDPNADLNLNLGRCMIILLGATLGVLLYCWAREWLGFYPAVLVLACCLVEPNLAAHATLVTTDFGITLFFLGTVYFAWRTRRRFSAWNLAGLAACFALACISKFTAVLLLPAGGLLLAADVLRRDGAITPRRAAGIMALLGLAAFGAIWAVYGFRYAPSDTPGWLFRPDDAGRAAGPAVVTRVLEWIDARHLLPNAYAQGFLLSVSQAAPLPGFLAGEISTTGWWYYFPAAFLLKTPLALILLAGAGLVVLAVRWRRLGAMNALHVLGPAAIYLAVAMASGIYLGVRHILPVYPFVLLVAAVVGWEIASRPRLPRVATALLGALLVYWGVKFARVYPANLTYFNVLAGGPANGARYLVDSNLDWGQHVKLLKRWVDRAGVKRINLAYFGTADPDFYDIPYISLPGTANFNRARFPAPELPGYVAISETIQSGVYYRPEWRLFYSGFRRLVPQAVIGNTIRVYWVDQWPEPAADDLFGTDAQLDLTQLSLANALGQLEWHELAVDQYRLYLQRNPADAAAWNALGLALLHTDAKDDAPAALARARELGARP